MEIYFQGHSYISIFRGTLIFPYGWIWCRQEQAKEGENSTLEHKILLQAIHISIVGSAFLFCRRSFLPLWKNQSWCQTEWIKPIVKPQCVHIWLLTRQMELAVYSTYKWDVCVCVCGWGGVLWKVVSMKPFFWTRNSWSYLYKRTFKFECDVLYVF
jgi:hypothetical protein